MFGKHLVDRNLLTEEDLLRALEEQEALHPSVGRLAFQQDFLDLDQIVEVLEAQRNSDLRFLAQAVKLGFMTDAQASELLLVQKDSQIPLGQVIMRMGMVAPEVIEQELDAYHTAIAS